MIRVGDAVTPHLDLARRPNAIGLVSAVIGLRTVATALLAALSLDLVSACLGALVPAVSALALEQVMWMKTDGNGRGHHASLLSAGLGAFSVGHLCAAALGCAALSAFTRAFSAKLILEFSIIARSKLRAAVVSRCLARSFGKSRQLSPGEGVSLVRIDSTVVADHIQNAVFPMISAAMRAAVVLVVVTVYDARMLPIALVFVPIVIASQYVWQARVQPLYASIQSERVKADRLLAAVLRGLRISRALGRTHSELALWNGHESEMASAERTAGTLNRQILAVWDFAIPAASIVLLWWSVWTDDLGPADVLLLSMCLGLLIGPLQQLFQAVRAASTSKASASRVDELLRQPIEKEIDGILVERGTVASPTLAVEGVSFGYLGRSDRAIADVSLQLRMGTSLAITGPSGSGKSTLGAAIAGLLRPSEGRVVIQVPDSYLPEHSVTVALVDQEAHLFEGSVLSNIRYGAPEATMDEVVRAARAACLDEFLRDPIGLDSAVGEGGEGVSGGQRCRIALARALVMNPMVLVVDEFSSQLDDELERRIIDRISGSRPNGFSVFITHSRVVAAAADRVLPLRDGRVFNEAAWI